MANNAEDNDEEETILQCSDPAVLQAFLEEGGKLPEYLPPGTQFIIETEDGRCYYYKCNILVYILVFVV
jgi:hypothetical protein